MSWLLAKARETLFGSPKSDDTRARLHRAERQIETLQTSLAAVESRLVAHRGGNGETPPTPNTSPHTHASNAPNTSPRTSPKTSPKDDATFEHREGLAHQDAKTVLAAWLREGPLPVRLPDGVCTEAATLCPGKPAYDAVHCEYAAAYFPPTLGGGTSLTTPWEEVGFPGPPTFEACQAYNVGQRYGKVWPKKFFDVACVCGGRVAAAYEVRWTHEVPAKKVAELRAMGATHVYEVAAEWVLAQRERPAALQAVRRLC